MRATVATTAADLDLPGTPRRLVSLVPSLTETVFDLGAGERVVGVTDWCGPALPTGATPARVGGVRDPRLDDLLALRPDLVLASREENRREHVEAIGAAAVPVLVADVRDLQGAAALVTDIGRILRVREAAEQRCRQAGEAVRRAAAAHASPVRVIYPIWNDPWMTVGAGSYAASVLCCAGFELVGAAGEGPYPRLDLDRAAQAAAVAVLLPDEPCDFHGPAGPTLIDELVARGLARPRHAEVDGRLAAWYGSRSGQRLTELAALRDRMA